MKNKAFYITTIAFLLVALAVAAFMTDGEATPSPDPAAMPAPAPQQDAFKSFKIP